MKIKSRKLEHLSICIEKDVEAGNTGFDRVQLIHKALPEIDFDKIDMSINFLGKKLEYPIIIEGMTGGVTGTEKINKDIAQVAEEFGIGFGIGSQRAAIEDSDVEYTYKVRDVAPSILLIANLGAVQLNYGYGIKECNLAIKMIDADALALHLNPLQEVIQPEGNKNFSNLAKKINFIKKNLKKPLIVKCDGSGISYEIAKKLKVDAIDVSGTGGTSWSLVESFRGDGNNRKCGKIFADWGISTVDSIKEISKLNVKIIGSGGIRTGIDTAKSIALGADCVGIALPILRSWAKNGKNGVREYIEQLVMELKIAMFLTGSKTVKELRGKIRG